MNRTNELDTPWCLLKRNLKENTRYFNSDALKLLGAVFKDLDQRMTHDGRRVIVNVGPEEYITSVFRARVFTSDEKLERALTRPELEMGPPPHSVALAGRMNAKGISVFYGANDDHIALAEVRPPVGSRVLVTRFKFERRLRLLDIEALRRIPLDGSVFDPTYLLNLEIAAFLEKMSRHIATPVMPDDEHSDYIAFRAGRKAATSSCSTSRRVLLRRIFGRGPKSSSDCAAHPRWSRSTVSGKDPPSATSHARAGKGLRIITP